ncbi:aldehyde dehydrogenase family protein [Streptomyces sp. NPDC003247]|uniref:aldehyde dehydrogenase family protein n=1 Tax=Streptomyces sp. NPDC003247 TaxID=3364677 RepID=UPI0036CB8627
MPSSGPDGPVALAELAERAGVPTGVFNVVTGDPRVIGPELTAHPLVRKLTFTGSTEVGRLLLAQSAQTVKKASMELGGNAPVLVFDDADLDVAVEGVFAAKYRNTGQACISANRVYVQDGVYDAFAAGLAERVADLVVGDGFDDGVHQGPLIDTDAVAKVESHVADAVAHGAVVLHGGKRHPRGGSHDLADADLAVLRLGTPYDPRPGRFEAFFHAGRLDFPAHRLKEILALLDAVPTVVAIHLERPAVVPEIADRSAALLASFGADDTALLDVVFGRARPEGQLPFQLPRSVEEVRAGRPDVPQESADPLSTHHAVEIDGDEATTRSYLVAAHVLDASDPSRHADGTGWYHCGLRRTPQGWKFAHVALDIVHVSGEPIAH